MVVHRKFPTSSGAIVAPKPLCIRAITSVMPSHWWFTQALLNYLVNRTLLHFKVKIPQNPAQQRDKEVWPTILPYIPGTGRNLKKIQERNAEPRRFSTHPTIQIWLRKWTGSAAPLLKAKDAKCPVCSVGWRSCLRNTVFVVGRCTWVTQTGRCIDAGLWNYATTLSPAPPGHVVPHVGGCPGYRREIAEPHGIVLKCNYYCIRQPSEGN